MSPRALALDLPGNRAQAGLAYDTFRDRVVLYGGTGNSTDTWEWGGTWWLRRNTQRNPGVLI